VAHNTDTADSTETTDTAENTDPTESTDTTATTDTTETTETTDNTETTNNKETTDNRETTDKTENHDHTLHLGKYLGVDGLVMLLICPAPPTEAQGDESSRDGVIHDEPSTVLLHMFFVCLVSPASKLASCYAHRSSRDNPPFLEPHVGRRGGSPV
jgi:hypothetical protein